MAQTPCPSGHAASKLRPVTHPIGFGFLVRHPGDQDGLLLAVVFPVDAIWLQRVKP